MIKKYHVSKNLYNNSTTEQGYRIQWGTGAPYADATALMSDYITVSNGKYRSDDAYFVIGYDANKEYIGAFNGTTRLWVKEFPNPTTYIDVAQDSDVAYIKLMSYGSYEALTSTSMLNQGEAQLPYEPYDTEVWHTITYRKYETATDTITSLPKTIIGDGQNISAYTIKGNMAQSGTPTPSSPIYPTECGERTENLLNVNDVIAEYACTVSIINNKIVQTNTNISYSRSAVIINNLDTSKEYYVRLKYSNPDATSINVRAYDIQNNLIAYSATKTDSNGSLSFTFTPTASDCAIKFYSNTTSTGNTAVVTFSEIFLSEIQATAPPYEPYGYKIPITLGGNTYPVYLSEPIRKASDSSYYDVIAANGAVTRNVRKVELTGEENIEYISNYGQFKIQSSYYKRPAYSDCTWWCSHYKPISNSASWSGDNYITISQGDTPDRYFRIKDSRFTTEEDFKTYLAQQYATGTPVTIWLVMAASTTDSITAPTLPTSGTAESFDVDTTLKPSEVSLTYHGWHEHSDTKFT